MDVNLVYWTAALANLLVMEGFLLSGVRSIRRGDLRGHRRRMLAAAALVGLFVASYVLKVALLGREDRSQWTPLDLVILYAHELCILIMLVGGATAGFWARRMAASLAGVSRLPPDEGTLPARRAHRRAGRVAMIGSLLALAGAALVLAGMYARVLG